MASQSTWSRRRLVISISVIVFGLILWHLHTYQYDYRSAFGNIPGLAGQAKAGADEEKLALDDCAEFPDPGNVAVIVKTGATVAAKKLPAFLETSVRCVKDPILISEVEQQVGSHKVYDVLANFTPSVMESNADFDFYRKVQEYAQTGRESEFPSLGSMPMANSDWRTEGHNAAWGLDKYKFLHMFEFAWKLQPNKEWYLMLEADTYLNWPAFLQWTATLDPTRKLYFGNAVRMWEHKEPFHFGHGGSGVVLSGAVVREWMTTKPGLANSWDSRIYSMWFGDYVLALALRDELGVEITNAFPSIQGDRPDETVFSEKSWCMPVLTEHHMDASMLREFLALEQEQRDRPLEIRDLFFHFGYDKFLARMLPNWNNFADDVRFLNQIPEPKETDDPEECEAECVANEKCLAWNLIVDTVTSGGSNSTTSKCYRTWVFRHGEARQPEVSNTKTATCTSGYQIDRVKRLSESCQPDHIAWPG